MEALVEIGKDTELEAVTGEQLESVDGFREQLPGFGFAVIGEEGVKAVSEAWPMRIFSCRSKDSGDEVFPPQTVCIFIWPVGAGRLLDGGEGVVEGSICGCRIELEPKRGRDAGVSGSNGFSEMEQGAGSVEE